MNVSKLKEILYLVNENESHFLIQRHLNELIGNIANLNGQTQNPHFQQLYVAAFQQLEHSFDAMIEGFTPAQLMYIHEIGGENFFTNNLIADIRSWMQENVATLTVALQKVQDFTLQRQSFIDRVTQTLANLEYFGVEINDLSAGQAEIGFMIPRPIFENTLDLLIKEVQVINRIIRVFSEVTVGACVPIEVRQISTTDPNFYFGLAPEIVDAIGRAIVWGLDVLKKLHELKSLKAAMTNTKEFSPEEIEKLIDEKIKNKITNEIDGFKTNILESKKLEKGRKHEIETSLNHILEDILSRVESGMTVEVRFIPPPHIIGTEDSSVFASLNEIPTQLVFPKVEETRLLLLKRREPPIENDGKENSSG